MAYVSTKTDTFTFGQAYFKTALAQDIGELIENAETNLYGQNIKFDSMVGIGLSGLLALPTLARHFKVPFLALRKPGVKSHDLFSVGEYGRGSIGRNWILIDDFVSSGGTIATARDRVENGIARANSNFSTTYQGTYCYDACYGSAMGKFVHPNGDRKSLVKIFVDGEKTFVDGDMFAAIKKYLYEAIQQGFPDPKGYAISEYRMDYGYKNPDLDECAMLAVAAENELRENNLRLT